MQKRFDHFISWYNQHRPHQALDARTPDEVWNGKDLPEPIPIRANDLDVPTMKANRINYRGDPRLPILELDITWETKKAA